MPEDKSRDPGENGEKKGRVLEFPMEEIRMPTQELPPNIGRIDDRHPLRIPLAIAIVVLGIIILFMLGSAVIKSFSSGMADSDQPSILNTYREAGSITYMDSRLDGWFLEESRQHFMDQDGNRYTYVDSHSREGSRVMGYWRIIE